MKLIVGLGNIGTRYQNTYHNIGFLLADRLAKRFNAKFSKNDCKADIAEIFENGQKFVIAKPRTFMNLSGDSILAFASKYKLDPENILIVFDDIDLELGKIRYRTSGSAGTHNGMRDIVDKLGQNIKRLRIGIGKPVDEYTDLADFVLSKITGEAAEKIEAAILQALEIAEGFIRENIGTQT